MKVSGRAAMALSYRIFFACMINLVCSISRVLAHNN